jgi:hypothetical protein
VTNFRNSIVVVLPIRSEPITSTKMWLGLSATIAVMTLLGSWFTGAL